MPDYQLYFLSGNGKSFAATDIHAEDEIKAIELARIKTHGRTSAFELWQEARLVHRERPDKSATR
jgi:hypothetical protein